MRHVAGTVHAPGANLRKGGELKRGKRLATGLTLAFLAALAVACGGGDSGPDVVVTGEIAAGDVGIAAGIGSYDIAETNLGLLTTLYGLDGKTVARVNVELRPTEGFVFQLTPATDESYTEGSMTLLFQGAPEAANEVARVEFRVADERAPWREVRLDILISAPAGDIKAEGSRVMLRAPVNNIGHTPPGLGASMMPSSGTAQATLVIVDEGQRDVDNDELRSWFEALGFGQVVPSPTASALLAVLLDAKINEALIDRAHLRLQEDAASVQAGLGTLSAALDLENDCDPFSFKGQCNWECRTEGPLPESWLALGDADCFACMTLYLPRIKLLHECIAARYDAVDEAWCKVYFRDCGWGLHAVPTRDGRTCRCTCNDATCRSFCAIIGGMMSMSFDGVSECDTDELACNCAWDPSDYCLGQWGERYCGRGAYVDPQAGFACETAECGDGVVNTSCTSDPNRVEVCDGTAPSAHEGCGPGFECMDCQCLPCSQTVQCGDGRISTNCPDFPEECDPGREPSGCPPNHECVYCGCVEIPEQPQGPDTIGPWPTDTGGGDIPAVCAAMLACAQAVAPDQYPMLYQTVGPGGSCYRAINAPPGTCEAFCQDGLDAWRKAGDC